LEGEIMNASVGSGEILIVEDDREFVEDLFMMWTPPLPVARASSGREAFEYLSKEVPSLVLLDINLPHYLAEDDDSEGFGILSYIKSCVGADVPVFMVTRETTDRARARAVSLGAENFFPKPLDVSELEKAVSIVINDRKSCSS
jgi:DNA-binding response OmpR family regulator